MTRITHVLCPIDFSAFSRHAFERALAIARAHRATVTALHVFPTPSAVAAGVVPFGPEGPGPFALHHLDQEKLTRELVEFLSIDPSLGVPVDFKVIEGRSTLFVVLIRISPQLCARIVRRIAKPTRNQPHASRKASDWRLHWYG